MAQSSSHFTDLLETLPNLDKALLRGAAQGLTSKEIGLLVGRSHHTVNDRFKAVTKRLKARDRAHAGRMLTRYEAGQDPLNEWGAHPLGVPRCTEAAPDPWSGGRHDQTSSSKPISQRCGSRALSAETEIKDHSISKRTSGPMPHQGPSPSPGEIQHRFSADQERGPRRFNRELGRNRTSVPRPLRTLGPAERIPFDSIDSFRRSLRVGRKDIAKPFRHQQYSKQLGHSGTRMGHRGKPTNAVGIPLVFLHILSGAAIFAILILVITTSLDTIQTILAR